MAVDVVLADSPRAWELDTRADMHEAADELCDLGYRGELSWAKPDPESDAVWMLVLTPEVGVGAAEVRAVVGDRLLLAGGVLRRLSAAEFAAVTA